MQQSVDAAALARPGLPLSAVLAAPAFGLGLDWVGVRHTLAGLGAVIGATGLVAALRVARRPEVRALSTCFTITAQ